MLLISFIFSQYYGNVLALGTSSTRQAIAKPLKTRGLAIFLFSNFPTISPHLQVYVQSEPVFPTRKARIRDEL